MLVLVLVLAGAENKRPTALAMGLLPLIFYPFRRLSPALTGVSSARGRSDNMIQE